MNTVTEEMLTLTQASKRTVLGEPAIRRGIKQGSIEAKKLGRDWFLTLEEVQRLSREYPLEG